MDTRGGGVWTPGGGVDTRGGGGTPGGGGLGEKVCVCRGGGYHAMNE